MGRPRGRSRRSCERTHLGLSPEPCRPPELGRGREGVLATHVLPLPAPALPPREGVKGTAVPPAVPNAAGWLLQGSCTSPGRFLLQRSLGAPKQTVGLWLSLHTDYTVKGRCLSLPPAGPGQGVTALNSKREI